MTARNTGMASMMAGGSGLAAKMGQGCGTAAMTGQDSGNGEHDRMRFWNVLVWTRPY